MTDTPDPHTQDARTQDERIQGERIDAVQQQVLDEARKVNEERLKAVEDLAAAVAFRVDLERQLHEAKKEEKRLMTAAEKQGWTRAQVNKFARTPKTTKRAQPQTSGQTSNTSNTSTDTAPAGEAQQTPNDTTE